MSCRCFSSLRRRLFSTTPPFATKAPPAAQVPSVPPTSTPTPSPTPSGPPLVANTQLPTITDPQVGVATQLTTGLWANGPISFYHFQWHVEGADVGEFSSTYTPVAGDAGKQLSVTVGARSDANPTLVYANSQARTVRAAAASQGTPTPTPTPAPSGYQPLGFNVGLGHAGMSPGTTSILGGKQGTNYFYPELDEIDMLALVGVRDIRVGFIGSRVAPTKFGAYHSDVAAYLLPALRRARAHGMRVKVEAHEYGRSYGVPLTIGTVPEVIHAANAFAEFKNDPGFVLEFMNEPTNLGDDPFAIIQEWINKARDAGWLQTLAVPIQGYSGLPQMYDSTVSRVKMPALSDPLTGNRSKLLYEAHYYYDINLSSNPYWSGPGAEARVWTITDADVDSGAYVAKFKEITTVWEQTSIALCRTYGMKLSIGETALANTRVGNACRPLLIEACKANADVIDWVTYWVAGEDYDPNDPFLALTKGGTGDQAVMTDLGMRIVNDRRAKLGLSAMAKPAAGTPFAPGS